MRNALAAFKAKSGRSSAATESLSLCVAKEKVTKEKGHPAWRLLGILPNKSVSRGRAFRTGILPVRKGADIPVGSRYAACRPRLTAAQGPRVEQRAILARTRCATAARLRELRDLGGEWTFQLGHYSQGQHRYSTITARRRNDFNGSAENPDI